ncbi:10823_t:CDS:1, partial [Diversispora eburnea]
MLVFVILTTLSTHSAPVLQENDAIEAKFHQPEVTRFALTSNRVLETRCEFCGGFTYDQCSRL